MKIFRHMSNIWTLQTHSDIWLNLLTTYGDTIFWLHGLQVQLQPGVVLRCDYCTEGAPRQISEVHKWYIAQQGSVYAWTGLGFNLCVAPTLTFCPYISDGQMDWGLDRIRRVSQSKFCRSRCFTHLKCFKQNPRYRTRIKPCFTQMHAKASQRNHDEFLITILISTHRIMFHGNEIIT